MKSFLLPIIFIALSIPAVWHIITPGYFPMHDDTQIVRVQQMYKALRDGQFPVRWVPDLGYGYGYPIFNFYNPLPYYIGGLSMFFGFDALAATKLVFMLAIIGSLFSMYLFARLVLSQWGALGAGIFYLYAPYHGVQIYVRGAVAEYWAYAILPLVFYGLWKRKIIFSGVAFALLITSHNLTAFMSTPFLIILFLFQCLKTLKSTHGAFSLILYPLFFILALSLSAFFWLPALLESSRTRVSEMVFQEFDSPALHVVSPAQLWTGPWGYGGSSKGLDDGLSLQLGKIHIVGSFAAVVTFMASWLHGFMAKHSTMKQYSNVIVFSVIGLLCSIFMMLPVSRPIWNSFSTLSYIQFPWRFLTFASLFSSLLAAISVEILRTKFVPAKTYSYVCIVFCVLFIVYSLKFFQPQFKFPTTAGEQTTREKIVWEVSKRSDEYLPQDFEIPRNKEMALRDVNTKNQELIEVFKKTTLFQTFGNIISVLSIIVIFLYLLQSNRNIWITK